MYNSTLVGFIDLVLLSLVCRPKVANSITCY